MPKININLPMSKADRLALKAKLELKSSLKSSGCIEFTRSPKSSLYGSISFKGATMAASRAAYAANVGPIPNGMLVCHKCDNPPCIRIDHLFLGTAMDNRNDAVSKGRMKRSPKNKPNSSVKMNPSIVAVMKKLRPISYSKIAKTFRVSTMTAYNAINGISWRK